MYIILNSVYERNKYVCEDGCSESAAVRGRYGSTNGMASRDFGLKGDK